MSSKHSSADEMIYLQAYCTLIAVLVGLYHTVAVPRGAPDWPTHDTVTVLYQPFAISSFAMSLLMVFRTNSSYAR